MIEFNGYISGEAEKYFWKNSKKIFQKIILCTFLLLAPPCVIIPARTQFWILPMIYCSLFVFVMLLTFLPKSKKERKSMVPKRIFTDGEFIISIAEKYEDTKKISDVKIVRDYGEFYELVFPFGKISEKYICQKDLLTKGTIEEFEQLFGEKLIKVEK